MNILLFKNDETSIDIKDERAEHLKKVLHLSVGDSFKAGIINGKQGIATIESIENNRLNFSFDFTEDYSELYPLTMIIAQVRPICMKRILREAVSLGVGRLILPVSELGEKSYLKSSLYTTDEYSKILIDGAMQAGFTGVSECLLARSVEHAIELAGSGERLLLDNVIGAKPLSSLDLRNKNVILAIGPERGWTTKERELFIESGFAPCLLGSRILRTETAAVAGAGVVLSAMGLL